MSKKTLADALREGVSPACGESGELVAAESKHDVVLAERLIQHIGKKTEYGVADLMTVRIIDLLEVIQIKKEERLAMGGSLSVAEQPLCGFQVVQSGGSIGTCLLFKTEPVKNLFMDVARHAEYALFS